MTLHMPCYFFRWLFRLPARRHYFSLCYYATLPYLIRCLCRAMLLCAVCFRSVYAAFIMLNATRLLPPCAAVRLRYDCLCFFMLMLMPMRVAYCYACVVMIIKEDWRCARAYWREATDTLRLLRRHMRWCSFDVWYFARYAIRARARWRSAMRHEDVPLRCYDADIPPYAYWCRYARLQCYAMPCARYALIYVACVRCRALRYVRCAIELLLLRDYAAVRWYSARRCYGRRYALLRYLLPARSHYSLRTRCLRDTLRKRVQEDYAWCHAFCVYLWCLRFCVYFAPFVTRCASAFITLCADACWYFCRLCPRLFTSWCFCFFACFCCLLPMPLLPGLRLRRYDAHADFFFIIILCPVDFIRFAYFAMLIILFYARWLRALYELFHYVFTGDAIISRRYLMFRSMRMFHWCCWALPPRLLRRWCSSRYVSSVIFAPLMFFADFSDIAAVYACRCRRCFRWRLRHAIMLFSLVAFFDGFAPADICCLLPLSRYRCLPLMATPCRYSLRAIIAVCSHACHALAAPSVMPLTLPWYYVCFRLFVSCRALFRDSMPAMPYYHMLMLWCLFLRWSLPYVATSYDADCCFRHTRDMLSLCLWYFIDVAMFYAICARDACFMPRRCLFSQFYAFDICTPMRRAAMRDMFAWWRCSLLLCACHAAVFRYALLFLMIRQQLPPIIVSIPVLPSESRCYCSYHAADMLMLLYFWCRRRARPCLRHAYPDVCCYTPAELILLFFPYAVVYLLFIRPSMLCCLLRDSAKIDARYVCCFTPCFFHAVFADADAMPTPFFHVQRLRYHVWYADADRAFVPAYYWYAPVWRDASRYAERSASAHVAFMPCDALRVISLLRREPHTSWYAPDVERVRPHSFAASIPLRYAAADAACCCYHIYCHAYAFAIFTIFDTCCCHSLWARCYAPRLYTPLFLPIIWCALPFCYAIYIRYAKMMPVCSFFCCFHIVFSPCLLLIFFAAYAYYYCLLYALTPITLLICLRHAIHMPRCCYHYADALPFFFFFFFPLLHFLRRCWYYADVARLMMMPCCAPIWWLFMLLVAMFADIVAIRCDARCLRYFAALLLPLFHVVDTIDCQIAAIAAFIIFAIDVLSRLSAHTGAIMPRAIAADARYCWFSSCCCCLIWWCHTRVRHYLCSVIDLPICAFYTRCHVSLFAWVPLRHILCWLIDAYALHATRYSAFTPLFHTLRSHAYLIFYVCTRRYMIRVLLPYRLRVRLLCAMRFSFFCAARHGALADYDKAVWCRRAARMPLCWATRYASSYCYAFMLLAAAYADFSIFRWYAHYLIIDAAYIRFSLIFFLPLFAIIDAATSRQPSHIAISRHLPADDALSLFHYYAIFIFAAFAAAIIFMPYDTLSMLLRWYSITLFRLLFRWCWYFPYVD